MGYWCIWFFVGINNLGFFGWFWLSLKGLFFGRNNDNNIIEICEEIFCLL